MNMRLLLIVAVLACAHAHGRLTKPVARNAMKNNAATQAICPGTNNIFSLAQSLFSDDQKGLAMGGPPAVQKSGEVPNGGKFMTADQYFPGVKRVPADAQGKPYPSMDYPAGSVINVEVLISAKHKGFFEFSLCTHYDLITTYSANHQPQMEGGADIASQTKCAKSETELSHCKTQCSAACDNKIAYNQAFGKTTTESVVLCQCSDGTRKYIDNCLPCDADGNPVKPFINTIDNMWWTPGLSAALNECFANNRLPLVQFNDGSYIQNVPSAQVDPNQWSTVWSVSYTHLRAHET